MSINKIITEAFKFAKSIDKKLHRGLPLGDELWEQEWQYDKCTVFIRTDTSYPDGLWTIFMQIRVDGLIATVVFPCNITLNDLKKLVREELYGEKAIAERQIETIDSFIREIGVK